jgi:DNA-binding response OmpR family regulator
MALEAYLEDAGIDVAGPFPSSAEVAAWAQTYTPELAILDYKLKDGPCVTIAKNLLARGVPVIIYSGMRLSADKPHELAGVRWLEKTVERGTLLKLALQIAPSLACRVQERAV